MSDGGAVHGTPPGPPPWAAWPIGSRVVLRRRLAEGGLSDALGDLVHADATHAVVRTRRGDVTVAAADVVAAKRVPPPPPPRPARAAPPRVAGGGTGPTADDG